MRLAQKCSMEAMAQARQVYRTIDAFGWDISWKHDKPVPDDAWPIDIIARALDRFRREGDLCRIVDDGGEMYCTVHQSLLCAPQIQAVTPRGER